MRPTWDEYFVGIAESASKRSKDPSTQCGAVIVRPDNTIAATGYNGFPRKIFDNPEFLRNREEKYPRTIHAEMNAILTAKEPLEGYTMYVWPFLTCERCAVHVIQAGIVRVVAPAPTMDAVGRWGHSFNLARNLYQEAGIGVTEGFSTDERCPFCGKERLQSHPVAGHYETDCCHQVLANCCEGPVSALP